MTNYRNIIRTELANNSQGKQQHTERDFNKYISKSSSAWDEASDAFFVEEEDDNMDCGFFSSDDDMACMFFN